MSAATTAARAQVFALPDLGEGLTEAEIVRWVVTVGDEVAIDQTILEVETAKSVVEVPSPYAGKVHALHGQAGETLAVGAALITIAGAADAQAETYREEERAGSGNVLIGYGTSGGGAAGRRRRRRATAAAPAPVAAPAAFGSPPAVAPPPAGRPRVASPVVRRLARDGGVDLAALTPSGPDGVISREDVVRALAAEQPPAIPTATPAATPTTTPATGPATGPAPVPAAPSFGPVDGERRWTLDAFRKRSAENLARSRAEIPEATAWVDVDVTPLWNLREAARTPADPGPGILAYLARFTVAGLRRYPVLNASFDPARDEVVEHGHVALGLAVQGERGLVVAAVADAHRMTTSDLDVAIRDVTVRARDGRVTPQELTSATFTLNNYGSLRVDGSAAIIPPTQVGILGFGRMLDRAWVVDGELAVRKIATMSFVFDHRVCDGDTAAGFMRVVADAIEDPAAALRHL
ncbi:dihydrolipoamide acetyltransferase family protein [Nocardioides bigeumensis]|uniref:Dihydrolipoamide acetyltransferase component of pyruvate dehydrogenase complex n=1 Tax=Nocardioides bigeumensis TaxID=433657 RepID=A0ABN2YAB2_9ACTN